MNPTQTLQDYLIEKTNASSADDVKTAWQKIAGKEVGARLHLQVCEVLKLIEEIDVDFREVVRGSPIQDQVKKDFVLNYEVGQRPEISRMEKIITEFYTSEGFEPEKGEDFDDLPIISMVFHKENHETFVDVSPIGENKYAVSELRETF